MKFPQCVLAALIALLLVAGCSAPLPTATPPPPEEPTSTMTPTAVPRDTATPLPTPTPSPTAVPTLPPTLTPTPSAGYYRHPELGFWFRYPDGWFTEETNLDLPSVIISDSDDPVKILAGGKSLETGADLATFAREIKDDLGLAEQVDLLEDGPATLDDGSPAWSIAIGWEDESGIAFEGRGYVAITGSKGYLVLLYAHPEVMATRQKTFQSIAGSLHLEQPELYGVSRTNSLFLVTREPDTLDPVRTHEGAGSIVGQIFSGLVQLNENMQIEPNLAESWEISPDGMTYTFHLRPEAEFHDGRPVTASDVKASWERATSPQLESANALINLGDIIGVPEKLAGSADTISGVDAADDHTLVVTIDGPKPYFLLKLSQPVTFVTHPDNAGFNDGSWRQPIGSGPFKFRRWQAGEVIILDSNLNFYLPPPQISSVVYFLGNGGVGAYESGLVDVTSVSPFNLSRVQDPNDPLSSDLISGSLFCTRRVVFDMTRPPFDETAVRQAFLLAIDRKQLAELVLANSAIPATGILPPGMPGYRERPLNGLFDVAQARALLANSIFGDAANLPSLTFTTNGTGQPDPLATALADAWRSNLGVTIETELIDPDSYPDVISKRHGQLFTMDACAPYPDPESILDQLYFSESPRNYGGYANHDVDELLVAARIEPDPDQRIAYYQQAEDLIVADAASIETVYPLAQVLVRPYVKGFQLSPIPTNWPAWINIQREESS